MIKRIRAVAPGFRSYVPGVETATRWTYIWNSDKFIDEEKNVLEGSVIVADTCFFDVFDTEILAGNPKHALAQHACAMVSESFAEKLGGISQAIGKVIYNEELPNFLITVSGVFKDFPHNCSVEQDVLISMESLVKQSTDNWVGNDRYRGFVRLAEGTDPDMLAPAIRLMQEKNYPADVVQMAQTSGIDIRYFLTPLTRMYISIPQVKNAMIIIIVVAILLVLISLMNYVLMSVSALVNRSKEMGVRKCYGAAKENIYGIMAKEAAIDIVAAMAIVAVVLLSLKPILEDFFGFPMEELFGQVTYITLSVVALIVFAVAALLPGYLYSRIPVSAAIKNYKENRRVWKLALLFLQTTICTLLFTLVSVISAQYQKAVNDKPGYNYQDLLWTVLTGTDKTRHQGIIDELKSLPEVLDVQMSYSLPLDYSSGNNVLLPGEEYKELFNIADQYQSTAGLFEMLEIPFIEGRFPQSETEVAVSESFVEKMMEFQDWSDGAVGKQISFTEHVNKYPHGFTISGVYKDYRINTLTNQDTRASIKFLGTVGEHHMPFMAIKVRNVSRENIDKVEALIQSHIEHKDIEVKAYKDSMREAYSDERKMRNTVFVGCVVSILIALFGLIAYIRDESQRRSKEMAVRKINGASVREIIGVYVAEIVKLCLPAMILGNIGAYFASTIWLKNFSEKIALSPWYFILADIVILLLVVACVVLNSLRISRSNPVESLKNE
ncbi:MAG: ABC transporter permease [Bacteroidales bacterium]|nr:ABC transporter permease [Bacteroidales bacterium]